MIVLRYRETMAALCAVAALAALVVALVSLVRGDRAWATWSAAVASVNMLALKYWRDEIDRSRRDRETMDEFLRMVEAVCRKRGGPPPWKEGRDG